MADLIDRQALFKQIEIDSEGIEGSYGDMWKFIDTIKNMPSAELSTNLAEVGTDMVSKQAVLDLWNKYHSYIATKAIEFDSELRALPTAEPQIIYCKDCKYYHRNIACVGGEYSGCSLWLNEGNEIEVEENDFCSCAERRTDE